MIVVGSMLGFGCAWYGVGLWALVLEFDHVEERWRESEEKRKDAVFVLAIGFLGTMVPVSGSLTTLKILNVPLDFLNVLRLPTASIDLFSKRADQYR